MQPRGGAPKQRRRLQPSSHVTQPRQWEELHQMTGLQVLSWLHTSKQTCAACVLGAHLSQTFLVS